MFEPTATDKAIKYGAAAVVVVGALWAISHVMQEHRDEAHTRATAATVAAMDASLEPLQRLQDRAIDGMAAHVERIQSQQLEARVRAAELREAAKPKAYRWRDADGQWHISDRAPEGVEAEVIPLTQQRR